MDSIPATGGLVEYLGYFNIHMWLLKKSIPSLPLGDLSALCGEIIKFFTTEGTELHREEGELSSLLW